MPTFGKSYHVHIVDGVTVKCSDPCKCVFKHETSTTENPSLGQKAALDESAENDWENEGGLNTK